MLKALRIRDWKSFEEADFTFQEGTNVIVGSNFSGKISILDAISYALFGSLPDPKLPLHYLIRSGCKKAHVEAEFSIGNQTYLVRRTVSGKKRTVFSAHLYDASGIEIEGESSSVNKKISSLFQHSEDYFFRTIYMPEGSIHAFLTKPPKTGVKEEIDNALGITIITNLVQIVRKIKGDADRSLKNLEWKEKDSAKTVVSKEQMDEWSKEKSEIQENLNELRGVLEKIHNLDSTTREIKRRQKTLDSLFEGVLGTGRTLSRIDSAITEFEKNLDNEEKQKEQIITELADKQALGKNEKEHLSILEKAARRGEAKCPVCESDITAGRLTKLIESRKIKITELKDDLKITEEKLVVQKQKTQDIQNTLKKWRNRRGEIKTHFEELKKLVKEQKELKSDIGKQKRSDIQNQIREREKQSKDLEKKIHGAVIIEELRGADLEEQIRYFAHVKYLTKDLQNALAQTAQEFRDTRLSHIREKAREVWTSLVDGGPWDFDWDDKFIPYVSVGEQELHTRQLSGAEKLFILFSLRTAFAKTLGNPGFLLFDEPAEHLDPENQRRVVTALQTITEEIKQVIIVSCKPVLKESKWNHVFEITKTSGVSLVKVL